MKIMNKIIKFVCVTALAFGSVACNLDLAPKTSMGVDNISTAKDAAAMREGVYRLYRSIYLGEYIYYPDYQSDLFNELTTSGNRGGFMYRHNIVSSDGDVYNNWIRHYSILANINFLIGKIDAMYEGLSAEDKVAVDQYKGEMLIMRAATFRSLAMRFCKDYEPSTAATEYGVPIVTSYDPNYRPDRGTLAATYTQITTDIADAEKLISTAGKADAAYVTKDAITALKAQVALDMHDYTNASKYASSLYASYPLVKSAAELEKMWRLDTSTETIFQPAMTKTDLFGRFTDYHGGQWDEALGDYRCDVGFVPEQWVCDLYDTEKDWRYGPYVDVQHINNMATADVTGVVLTKFRGNINLQTGGETNLGWYLMPKVFRVAEMYLIDAEAQYRQSGKGLEPLNALRQARGLDALSGVTGAALFQEIKNERVREMIAEGGRLADLKRWGEGFTRNKQTSVGLLFSAGGHDYVMAADASRMVWPIPRNEIEANANLKGQQNAGWGE